MGAAKLAAVAVMGRRDLTPEGASQNAIPEDALAVPRIAVAGGL
jgi:hypothetical protein